MTKRRKQAANAKPTFRLETLERRILYSADPVGGFSPDFASLAQELVAVRHTIDQDHLTDQSREASLSVNELVLVDSSSPEIKKHIESLRDALDTDASVVRLPSGEDAIGQISEALAAHEGLSSLHILIDSHQAEHASSAKGFAAVELLSRATEISGWRNAFASTSGGAMTLYGVSAESAADINVSNTLARLTGLDVQVKAHPSPIEPAPGSGLSESAETEQAKEAQRQELVFISANIDDRDLLLEGIDPNFEVHVIDTDRDGLTQIEEILSGRTDVEPCR